MRPRIKEEKLYYFAIPGLIEKIVVLILRDFNATPIEAINAFYASPTYTKLEKKETMYWKMSPQKLYEDFLESTHRN